MSDQENRRYFYPIRNSENPFDIELVEITEEQYRALYPDIWRTQKRERNLGRCHCPPKHLWRCDADCFLCPYHAAGQIWSLEQEEEIMGDHHSAPNSDPSDAVTDQLLLRQLIHRLGKLCPEALEVGHLQLEGLSVRDAVEKLGLPRTSYRRHLKEAEKKLREEYGDIF